MTQSFENISPSEKISDSLSKLKNRDLTSLTMFSGMSFPENPTEDMLGTWCNRTDLKKVYHLESVNPSVVWTEIFDYNSRVPTASEIEEAYQPVNSNLTALSNVSGSGFSIPYFQTENTMALAPVTAFSLSFLQKSDTDQAVSALGLGELSKSDTVNGTTQINDNSIPLSKLSFDVSSAGYDVGDVCLTFSKKTDTTKWLEMKVGTIGNTSSGATVLASDLAHNLFLSLWTIPSLELQTSNGTIATKSTAENDWVSNCRLFLPDINDKMITTTTSTEEVGQVSTVRVDPSPLNSSATTKIVFSKIKLKAYIHL